VIKRIEGKGTRKLPKIKDDEQEPREQPNQEGEAKEEDKHEQGDEIPTQNENKNKKKEKPKKDNNQEQLDEHHHCHDCCSHDNPNPLHEDLQKFKQELKHRNEHLLSKLKQKSPQNLLESFGSELQIFKSTYTFYRYKDNPKLHIENCTKLSTYLTSHPIEHSEILLEELNIDTSSQQ
jgi:hypothetical protein